MTKEAIKRIEDKCKEKLVEHMKQFKNRGNDQGPPPGVLERRFESIIELWRDEKLEHVRPTIDAYEKRNKMRSFWVDCKESMPVEQVLELALHYIWDVSQGVE